MSLPYRIGAVSMEKIKLNGNIYMLKKYVWRSLEWFGDVVVGKEEFAHQRGDPLA
jgi:hypothetical protein